MSAAPQPRRRTQEERSAATRAALLDATIGCLLEGGYAQLTMNRIAARAGVSRGAIVHHYPTKTALVTDAVRYLADLRISAVAGELREIDAGTDRVDAALELLWEMHKGPLLRAVFQLSFGAPADDPTREGLGFLEGAVAETIRHHGQDLFGEHALRPDFDDILYTVLQTMIGLSVLPYLLPIDERDVRGRWRRTKIQLRRLFDRPD